MSYTAPVKDMLFVMKELAALEDIAKLPGFEDANLDTALAVLEESAKLCGEVLAPLVTRSVLEEVTGLVPVEWLGEGRPEDYVGYLLGRAPKVPEVTGR